MNEYLTKKVLSNNVVQAYDVAGDEECILLGKGIGFGLKDEEPIDSSKIEKKFYIKDRINFNKYQKLIENCDEKLMFLVENYIGKVEKYFGCQYSENLHIGLLDHLNFSLYRLRNNITISNLFIDEISVMYEKEYTFAKEMLEYLNRELGVSLPTVEIGFIALHIHSSIKGDQASQTALYINIIGQCMELIESEFGMKLDPKSLNRARLITHLKFALKRASENISVDNVIIDSLKSTYPKTFQFADRMAKNIFENYGLFLPEGEIGYLTIHIENIISGQRK
ncbi:PRD domain-containing protein [Anoxybacterium hadale]|uniref:PRD domain-containing protein n=1 Tax=Anoxybacterium hadale TaxID=3408580 RepID=A0ACD1AF53_9FIRM|nr:PRD domain-containing protein [Clostridiales bacterium]